MWIKCEMFSRGSCVGTFGPLLVALFWEVGPSWRRWVFAGQMLRVITWISSALSALDPQGC